jgi:hypothetical protein
MAFKLAEGFVDIFARTSRLTSGFDQVERQTNRLVQGLDKLSGAATAAIGGLALVGFFDKVVKAAMEAERSVSLVEAALRTNGQEVKENSAKIDEMANSLRDQVGFSDEAARAAAAYGIKMGASADQAIEMTKAAAGLADLFGGNLQSAMQAVTRAQQGNWMSLQRMIPALRQYHTVQEKMDFLVRRANQGIASQKDLLKDTQGHLTQLENAWSELAEAIGSEFLPVVKSTLGYLTLLAKALTPETVENTSFLVGTRKALYETEIEILEFIKNYRYLSIVLSAGTTLPFLPDDKEVDKKVKDLRDNIAYIMDYEKKMNDLAAKGANAHVKGIDAVNSALTRQQRILSSMTQYWHKVQESLFNPDIAFGAGRKNNAGGGRMPKTAPSGLMPTRTNPLARPGGGAGGGGGGTGGGTRPSGASGTPFIPLPGYMGSGGVMSGFGGMPSIASEAPLPPGPQRRQASEAHRRWAEHWNAHKGARTDRSDPTKVGGVDVPRNVVRDKAWHEANTRRLRDRMTWREEELANGNFRGSNVEYQKSIQERDRKELQRSSDIAEYGSTAKADFERSKARDRSATQDRINRVRKHLVDKATTEEEIQDAMKTAEENAKYEQKKMEARQKNLWEKGYKKKDEEERKRLGMPVDREAESVRKGLQQRFGVTQTAATGVVAVRDIETPKLVKAIDNLSKKIENIGGTFGQSEDE